MLAGTALDKERRIVSRGLDAVGVEDNLEVLDVNPVVFEVVDATGVFGAAVVTAVAVLGRAPTTTTRGAVVWDGDAVRPDVDFLPGVDRTEDDKEVDRCAVAPKDAREVEGILLGVEPLEVSFDAPTVAERVIPREAPETGVGMDVDLVGFTGILLSWVSVLGVVSNTPAGSVPLTVVSGELLLDSESSLSSKSTNLVYGVGK